MLIRLIVLIFVLLAFTVSGQTISLTGIVVDSQTSAALSGATVKLVEYPQVVTKTGVDGAFKLSGTAIVGFNTPENPGYSGAIKLSGNFMSVSGGSNLMVNIAVYGPNGVCLNYKRTRLSSKGEGHFGPLWNTPGFRYVKVELDGKTYSLFTNGISKAGISLSENKREMLAKSSVATYTLQVFAPNHISKNISLSKLTGDVGTIRLVADTQKTGVWTNVTPAEIANDGSGFGAGSIAGDPLRPGDMYVGGSKSGIWKTTDYGKTWTKINNLSPDVTRGCIIAVAGTTPATVYVAGFGRIFKSTDAGITFDTLSTGGFDPYSLVVDPYDPTHLLSGLHEVADVIESTNGGATWYKVGSGSIGGGVSVYPFFIDMGNAAGTRTTWFAIGQNGCSPGRTTNGGATWTMPSGLDNLQHPHGNARIFQQGPNVWVGGAYDFRGTIMRSTDYGVTFTKVTTDEKPEALIWGTEKNVYAMYAWACSRCDVQPNFEHAPLPGGTNWTYEATPSLKIGPNSIVVAKEGSHYVFVGLMWAEGLWRYVEP